MACGPKLRRTRFAPSPTGLLHLGHAYAALTAAARADPGEFLLRIEDIDAARCRPEFEAAIYEDLAWLGLDWQRPVLRQSERREAYDTALNHLISLGLCYPCRCSRGDIRAALSAPQEGVPLTGPDGLIYPGTCRERAMSDAGPADAIRLDMAEALRFLDGVPLWFTETGPVHPRVQALNNDQLITHVGDVILSRPSIGTSYHLAVVVDDAAQGITEVTRGEDLFEATRIHVVLQRLLELPVPTYRHHTLIRDDAGKRLAKRDDARAIRRYRDEGDTPADVRIKIGL
ncbi:tRNA glutamyl-Q(34) synthetase GluQRS [Frigidibacter albus]|uniref:tRNA glutamyl-Q(34) synthetase GluQRS n=1 Tax=Frigidibacter albus TaxID=1465486 RepID=A0A6L8VFF7_9RHOB|nr:tRNA glutamyl-Q(34) synthetase GluQRS [Frigidibacter albus]MZQ88029.1 tRNA glutamyl-Q(34) synthetase GluQRS [Frigidibacter albus]NBE30297.1 tRNA glutamyl-Q(34) synthetase GluQRS [Frigidibacter albus]GGH47942.1 tRNA glutamyl-Q synthetase [Frigidibacter albus]